MLNPVAASYVTVATVTESTFSDTNRPAPSYENVDVDDAPEGSVVTDDSTSPAAS